MRFKESPLLVYLSLFLLCTIPGTVLAQDNINWMEADAPPFFIHEGELKKQGYEDVLTKLMITQLPQYQHHHMTANIARHYQQWKQGEQSCALAMFKTPEREEIAYFSIPSILTLPVSLIIRKDNFDKFGGSQTVNLQNLLESNEVIVGRSNNRSYGVVFDAVLNKYGNDTNTFTYKGKEMSKNLFKMLIAGRIDALASLPEEATYFAEIMGVKDQITSLNITENQNDLEALLTYVTCSKTAWGKKAIEDINTVLLKQRPTEFYRGAYERWLDPSSIPHYRQLYKDVFLTITK
ncbi:MAG: ABC transporter substrate-binding protein [Desulfotalea sp.]|nr:MAG: ABC transporter substrate-binding protein [Desulfotalea sp.]